MVGFDDMSLARFSGGRLNDIRIDGTLGKPVHLFDFLARFSIENINKGIANYFALRLRIIPPFSLEEQFFSVGTR